MSQLEFTHIVVMARLLKLAAVEFATHKINLPDDFFEGLRDENLSELQNEYLDWVKSEIGPPLFDPHVLMDMLADKTLSKCRL